MKMMGHRAKTGAMRAVLLLTALVAAAQAADTHNPPAFCFANLPCPAVTPGAALPPSDPLPDPPPSNKGGGGLT